MKRIVRETDHNICLRLPAGLLLNRCTAAVLCRKVKKHGVKINRYQMRMLIKGLHAYRKAHPDWVLVEVNSAKGEHLQIKL